MDAGSENETIVFYKTKPVVITPDNLHSDISISTLADSPVSALYHSVQKVFAPLLLKVDSVKVTTY